MKKTTIIYWTATILIFFFQGLLPVLTSQSEAAKETFRHFGYPAYFMNMLNTFKALGALALVIPQVPPRIKEWAYAGFAIDFIAAFIAIWVVDGLSAITFFPLVILAVLIVSYINYHKLKSIQSATPNLK
jgi:hypothetical protein